MKLTAFAGLVLVCLVGSGCTQASRDSRQATRKAQSRKTYVMQNDVEFHNYNRRQQIADDPATVLWCTVEVGADKVTVPVLGKLTSSHKRPFGASGENSEAIGPDAMYGTSGEYRYGFGPSGVYFEQFQGGVCFDQPMRWQTTETKLASEVDNGMLETQRAVRAILQDAAKNGRVDPVTGRPDADTSRQVARMFTATGEMNTVKK